LELADLPPELVLHIMSFVPAGDLVRTVPLVCQLWKALSKDHMLWKALVERKFCIRFSDEVARQETSWSWCYYKLLNQQEDLEVSYHDPERKILGCKHYQRCNKVLAECCQRYFVCRHCHNSTQDHQINRYATKLMFCMACRTIQTKGPVCASSACKGRPMARYYCSICNFWDNQSDKSIFHCPDCNVCYLGQGLGIDYYHCTECNMCFDKRFQATHKHIQRK